jgi:hypothetical protein
MISQRVVVNLIQREIDKTFAAWGQATSAQIKDRYNYTLYVLNQIMEVLKLYGTQE